MLNLAVYAVAAVTVTLSGLLVDAGVPETFVVFPLYQPSNL